MVDAALAETLETLSVPDRRAEACRLDVVRVLRLCEGQWTQAIALSRDWPAALNRPEDLPAAVDASAFVAMATAELADFGADAGGPDPSAIPLLPVLVDAERALRRSLEALRETVAPSSTTPYLLHLARVEVLLGELDEARALVARWRRC